MSRVLYGNFWRGRSWEDWKKIFGKRTHEELKESIRIYTQKNISRPPGRSLSKDTEHLMTTLDAYEPYLNKEQVINAINGLPPPQTPGSQTRPRPPPPPVAGSCTVPTKSPDSLTSAKGSNVQRNPPSPGVPRTRATHESPISISSSHDLSIHHPNPRPSSAGQTTVRPNFSNPKLPIIIVDESGEAPNHPSTGPGIGQIQRDTRELLQSRHLRGLLLERGRPELIRNRPWMAGKTVKSKKEIGELHVDADNPHISDLQFKDDGKVLHGQNPHLYTFSSRAPIYPYYGRGPVWADNSCALDCCIVAARLLNVGSLSADKGEVSVYDWIDSLPPLMLHFLDLLALPWEIFAKDTIIAYRNYFRTKLGSQCQGGRMMSAVALWSMFTEGVNQFTYSEYWRFQCTKCGREKSNRASPTMMQDLALDASAIVLGGEPDMTGLLNTHFDITLKDCRKQGGGCGTKGSFWRRRIVNGYLPLRLAVLTPINDKDKGIPRTASNHIPIKYHNADGPQSANYRWIGGIYRGLYIGAPHYRVYWTDCQPGESEVSLKVYDGFVLSELFISKCIYDLGLLHIPRAMTYLSSLCVVPCWFSSPNSYDRRAGY